MKIFVTLSIAMFFGSIIGFLLGVTFEVFSDSKNKQFRSKKLEALYLYYISQSKKHKSYITLFAAGIFGLIAYKALLTSIFIIVKLGYPYSFMYTYIIPTFMVSFYLAKYSCKKNWVRNGLYL